MNKNNIRMNKIIFIILSFYSLFLCSCFFGNSVKLINLDNDSMKIKLYSKKDPKYKCQKYKNEWKDILNEYIIIEGNSSLPKAFNVRSLGEIYMILGFDYNKRVIFKKIFHYFDIKKDSFEIYLYDMKLDELDAGAWGGAWGQTLPFDTFSLLEMKIARF